MITGSASGSVWAGVSSSSRWALAAVTGSGATVTDNGDGTVTVSGVTVTDQGDGTAQVAGSVTDQADGTALVATSDGVATIIGRATSSAWAAATASGLWSSHAG